MSKPFLIGLTGGQRCGKDEVAKVINHLWPPRTQTLSFAAPLKRVCQDILYFNDAQLADMNNTYVKQLPSLEGVLTRQFIQQLGDGFRSITPHMFVLLLEYKIKNHFKDKQIIVIPDVRFSNEYGWIKTNNGLIVKIERSSSQDQQCSTSHKSETDRKSFKHDAVIKNEGTMDDLFKEVVDKVVPLVPKEILSKRYPGYVQVPENQVKQYLETNRFTPNAECSYTVDIPEGIPNLVHP